MIRVVAKRFGGPEVLELEETATPSPGEGEVLVRLLSVGMNHADLMGRRGEYKLSTGEPPFVPGLEGGGVIESVGAGVSDRDVGQRVVLGLDVARPVDGGGTYRSHMVVPARQAIVAPDKLAQAELGAIWLTHLTAWGCLVWRQNVGPGVFVGIPAASSGVGIAAAQIARRAGATTIGLTTSPAKVDRLRLAAGDAFDHLIVTANEQGPLPWYKDIRRVTSEHGVDVFFDPVAAGSFLGSEIRCLAQHGTIWVYGLLAKSGAVDVTPIIRKHATIRGWLVNELADASAGGSESALHRGYREVLDGFSDGRYRQPIDRTFPLAQAREAHEYMERGGHVGKIVLIP